MIKLPRQKLSPVPLCDRLFKEACNEATAAVYVVFEYQNDRMLLLCFPLKGALKADMRV